MGGGASRDYPQNCGKNVEKSGKNVAFEVRKSGSKCARAVRENVQTARGINLQTQSLNSQKNIINSSKNAHITNNKCTKTAKCAKKVGSMQNFQDNGSKKCANVNVFVRLKRQVKGLTILSTMVLFFAVATIMFCTLGGLSAHKTAVGSITFDFKSPSMNFNSGLEMYYSNLDASGTKLDTPKLTFGKSTGVGADTIAPYYMSFSSNQTGVSDYYVKLIYQFDGLDASKIQGINMGTSALAFGAKYMSAPTLVSGSTYKFESVSVAGASSLTHDKISAGQTFDLLQFMRNLSITFTEEEYSATSLNFSITTIVDLGDSFASSHKAQAVISGKVGYENYFVKDIAILSDNLEGSTYLIKYTEADDAGGGTTYWKKSGITSADGEDVFFNVLVSKKWKIEIPKVNIENTNKPFTNGVYTKDLTDNLGNAWTATLTITDKTYVALSFESVNAVSGKINLSTLFDAACWWPALSAGRGETDKTNEVILSFYADGEICDSLSNKINFQVYHWNGGAPTG